MTDQTDGTNKLAETAYIAKSINDSVIQMAEESDRAAVILCASKIDYVLYQLLVAFLLPNASANDDLLGSDRALGTFSARINACYRLGLIDSEMSRAINIIRRIRNNFAHESGEANLDAGAHRDRVLELTRPLRNSNLYTNFLDSFNDLPGVKNQTKARFIIASALILTALEVVVRNTHRIEPTAIAKYVMDE